MAVTSSFGTYHMPVTPKRYYQPSIQGWVARPISLAQTCDLRDFVNIVRVEFDKQFEEALNSNPPPWPGSSDYAWNYMTDATWRIYLNDSFSIQQKINHPAM